MKSAAVCSVIDKARLKKELRQAGFKVVEKNPDFVLCYGGDGTILYGEHKYPGVPKLAIKSTKLCHRCEIKSNGLAGPLASVKGHNYNLTREMKLEADYKKKKLIALNDFQIRSKLPTRAIRFSVYVDGKKFENLIGDGVIVATPFGATAYYSSTGGLPFEMGIGVSFNNLFMTRVNSFVVPDSSVVKVKIIRGPAWLIGDNHEKFIDLKNGETVSIRKSAEKAQFIKIY